MSVVTIEAMRTYTIGYATADEMLQGITAMENDGWAVRQVVTMPRQASPSLYAVVFEVEK